MPPTVLECTGRIVWKGMVRNLSFPLGAVFAVGTAVKRYRLCSSESCAQATRRLHRGLLTRFAVVDAMNFEPLLGGVFMVYGARAGGGGGEEMGLGRGGRVVVFPSRGFQ